MGLNQQTGKLTTWWTCIVCSDACVGVEHSKGARFEDIPVPKDWKERTIARGYWKYEKGEKEPTRREHITRAGVCPKCKQLTDAQAESSAKHGGWRFV